jgi:hypothetical protein
MTNDEMVPGRFQKMQDARRLYDRMACAMNKGGFAVVYTNMIARRIDQLSDVKLGRTAVYIRRGKSWDCINYCRVHTYL